MSFRFVINMDDSSGNEDHEIEFWPLRGKAQARETRDNGVVSAGPQQPIEHMLEFLKKALKIEKPERKEKTPSKDTINPCMLCKCKTIVFSFLDSGSQYIQMMCLDCKRQGTPSYYFKDCDLDGLSDEQIAIKNWNEQNPTDSKNDSDDPHMPYLDHTTYIK